MFIRGFLGYGSLILCCVMLPHFKQLFPLKASERYQMEPSSERNGVKLLQKNASKASRDGTRNFEM